MPKSKKKTAKKSQVSFSGDIRKAAIIAIAVILLLLIWVLSQSLFKAYPIANNNEVLSIKKGQTYSAFIQHLSEHKGVKFPIVLKLYQKLWIRDSLKAGVYQVNQGMSVRQVLDMLSNANNAQMNRIMVIEGTTFKQLKEKLKADPYVKKTVLDLPDAQLLQKVGVASTHPEGWFAPNTYFFAKDETDLNILKELYQRQSQILDEQWQNRAQNLPYKNKYQALIMASIVEKETSVESEYNKVAGVFVRRLKIGMRLQTDPTVIYGMGDHYHGNIRRKDLQTATPYNTYTIDGLPPTPIALPSERAIYAALHPDNGNALYFVATGKGGHKFSATLAEHNQAVAEYLQVLKENKRKGQ